MKNYREVESGGGVPIRAWVKGVPFEDEARAQLQNAAQLPFIFRWIAAMPDVHLGIGATVGSVIPTKGAIIPAAVGVDIGCGMTAVRTSLVAADLPDDLKAIRRAIEKAVPHGRSNQGRRRDTGAWHTVSERTGAKWASLEPGYTRIAGRHPQVVRNAHPTAHLGTLGTGNHFIEVCLDEDERVWLMLHSGSRGIGNRIGTYFIELAKKDMRQHISNLPDKDLAYLEEGTEHFDEYVEAVGWAQDYARANRELMMDAIIEAVRATPGLRPFTTTNEVVNCHHNYVARERHFGEDVLVTRKGAVRAGLGELGIIPGSMGARSFIVSGLGNPDSFMSCSHGAGRSMSRAEARRRFTVEDHAAATRGIECRKDVHVIDETPAAYKPIEAVMAAQSDLVEIVHTLHQVVCVKG
jgi:tRNA-splicing ligase RtcB